MNVIPAEQQVSMFQYLLRVGLQEQLIIIALGITFLLMSTAALLFTKNRTLISGLGFLSLLPGIIGIVSITNYVKEFLELATAQTAPKPAEFVEAVGGIIGAGFWGLLMTIIPVGLCMIALLKAPSAVDQFPLD